MDNHIFRSAINGFNRQDVTAYIEKAQADFAEKESGLEAELTALRQERDGTGQELADACQQRDALSEQVQTLEEQLQAATDSLSAAAAAGKNACQSLAERENELRDVCAERDELRRMTEQLQQQVEAFRQEKERIAQLELDAQRRAAVAVDEAKTQAEAILQEAEEQARAMVTSAQEKSDSILSGAETKVGETADALGILVSGFDAVATHIAAELRKMDVTTSQLPICFNRLREDLKGLREKAQQKEEQKNQQE